jgi:ribose 5-phosphate isomerase B
MAHDEARSAAQIAVPHRKAIGLANDHAGYPLKLFVRDLLAGYCDEVIDVGAQSEQPVDFPDVTARAIQLLRDGKVDRVVLVCGTGAGACIAANKYPGIRAAVAHDTYVARQAVEHDNINVLCIGGWIIGPQIAADVVRAFLASEFSTQEQFRRRVEKLALLDGSLGRSQGQ